MIVFKKPKVCVLLAAYNGEKYISEQIISIQDQINVDLDLYISIDKSNDRTEEICKNLNDIYKNIFILNKSESKFGCASNNFYHLFKKVEIQKYDFVALSDQDDIWLPKKLDRGISLLLEEKALGYSSDVECFWPKGNRKIIKKSYPQKKFDFYFEAAGPGCTYIINNKLSIEIKKTVLANEKLPFHHDWFIYAFARSKEYKWIIDNQANLLYRQHSNNQVGANYGISAISKRLKQITSREYQKNVYSIIEILEIKNHELNKKILLNPFSFRRNKKEAIVLFLFTLLGFI